MSAGPPFAELACLYVGTRDVAGDLAYDRDVLGGEKVRSFSEFGSRLAFGPLCSPTTRGEPRSRPAGRAGVAVARLSLVSSYMSFQA